MDSLSSAYYRLHDPPCHAILRMYRRETQLKLKEVTFCLGDTPMRELLWCNTVPKGKRCKPAKINGVQHHEISESVEPTYFQPL